MNFQRVIIEGSLSYAEVDTIHFSGRKEKSK